MAILSLSQIPPDQFAEHIFAGAPLGDKRRTRRAVAVASQMLLTPGVSFSAMYSSWGQSKAAYRLMSNGAVSPEGLVGGHFERVRRALPCDGRVVLLIEDTSEIDYTFRAPIEGLSRVGPGNVDHQGFLLHSVIAAVPGGEMSTAAAERQSVRILGLAHQEYFLRSPVPVAKRAVQAHEDRESALFERSTTAIGRAPQGSRLVRVADRGADIYLVLARYQAAGHQFVVRAKFNRQLAKGAEATTISEALEGAPWCAQTFDLALRARPGQGARVATMQVRMAPVRLAVPRFNKEARERLGLPLEPIECTVVHLLEHEATAAEPTAEPERRRGTKLAKRSMPSARLEWKLLVSGPVEDFDQAVTAARHYATRWIIEEFHRTLKEGMGAERLQMETGQALMNTVAMMSPLALRVVDLREHSRLEPQSPAAGLGLTPLELELLSGATNHPIKTVEDAAKAIGKLGGHVGRKSDGMPGVKTLFLGLRKLQSMVEAIIIYESRRSRESNRSG
ncbi:MAG: hypothetical protein EI684_18665 [Candidatus Viridilinea halotolerans]|uniref:IS4 family transposase n=1 Tax=Candidatus Viridilinea halotolerans TaxID=2491704 RepID=A0A426TT58_9CHLR|nr:MAG: hypothetical protein EI684_18665 [Candidatus Viridilinea halotolerans]